MKSQTPRRILAAMLLWALLAALPGCEERSAAPAAKPPVQVTVATVQKKDVPILVRAVGTLRANRIARISAQIAGNLTELKFEDGDDVKAGQPIALLDSDVQQSSYDAAKAAMETAKYTYENTKELLKAEASTPYEVTQNLNAYNQSQSQVAMSQAVLDKLTLKAPFAGRLSIHMRDEGDYLDQGDSIVTLVDDDPMLVDYRVPEKYVERLAVGQKVSIAPTATASEDIPLFADSEAGVAKGQLPAGKVTAIDPQIDRGTRTVLVRASAPNPDGQLVSGRFVRVEQTLGNLPGALLIPQQAIVLDTKGAAVFVLQDDQTVKRQKVTLGEYLGTDVVVAGGLSEGDRVVTRGWQKLHTGAKVKVASDEGSPTPASESAKSGIANDKTSAKPQAAKDEGATR